MNHFAASRTRAPGRSPTARSRKLGRSAVGATALASCASTTHAELGRRLCPRSRAAPRPARRPGRPEREEARRPLVVRPGPKATPPCENASASGVDRDPGHTTASWTPAATSSSTKARRPAASLIARRPGYPERDHGVELDPRLLRLEVRDGTATMPHPAKSVAFVRSTIPHRSATHSSPSPSAPSQPPYPVPAPVEALVLVQQRKRHVAGSPPTAGVGGAARRAPTNPCASGTVPEISVTRCWTKRSVMTPGSGATVRVSATGAQRLPDGRDDDRVLLAVLSDASRARPSCSSSARSARAGSSRRRRPSGRCGPRSRDAAAPAWPPGTSARRAGTRRSCSRGRWPRGAAGRSRRRAPPAIEAHPAREHHLVDAPAPDGARNMPTSRRQSSLVGCSSTVASGRRPASRPSRSGWAARARARVARRSQRRSRPRTSAGTQARPASR